MPKRLPNEPIDEKINAKYAWDKPMTEGEKPNVWFQEVSGLMVHLIVSKKLPIKQ